MALDMTVFSDEQRAEIQAEIDRERTKASETARKNAQKAADADVQSRIEQAVADERAKLEMDEHQKLEADRAKVEELAKKTDAERKSFAAERKLIEVGGFDKEAIEKLLPLFTTLPSDSFDGALDSFIEINKATVDAQVDAVKQTLLSNGQPAPLPNGGNTDTATLANETFKAGDLAQGIEYLLQAAEIPA